MKLIARFLRWLAEKLDPPKQNVGGGPGEEGGP